jgi:hypothetical protein
MYAYFRAHSDSDGVSEDIDAFKHFSSDFGAEPNVFRILPDGRIRIQLATGDRSQHIWQAEHLKLMQEI